jgi:hypothetical protein
MSRQLEQQQEERTQVRHSALIRAMEFELQGVVAAAGGHLTGFSIKIEEYSVLMTLRGVFSDTPMIAFVGADTMPTAICKSVSEVRNNQLSWRKDKYNK